MLYQLLTGRPPFEGKSGVAALAAVVRDEPPAPRNLRKDLPRDLEAICLKCIAKRKEDRYATANELAQDLERFLEGQPTLALPATPLKRLLKWVRRRPAVATIYGLLLSGLVAFTAIYVISDLKTREALKRAESAERTAKQEALNAKTLSYATEMSQAQQYYEEGNVPLLLETLKRYLPEPGEEDLRTFPWFHLWHKVHQSEKTLVGHEGDVHSLSYSPNGQRLVSSGADGTVRLWNVSSGRLIKTFQAHETGCNVVRYLPSGSEAVSVGDDGKFMRIDLVGDAPPQLIWQSEHKLEALDISKDGGRAVVADGHGTATVFNTETWKKEHSWKPHNDNVYALEFSPDGTMLLSACRTGGVALWKVPEWTLIDHLDDGRHHISSAGFSPDGQYVRISYRARGETEVLKLKIVDRRGPPKSSGPFFRSLGMVDGNRPTYAEGISGDGKVVVGHSKERSNRATTDRAFRWTEKEGFQPVADANYTQSPGVSVDGSRIVGFIGSKERAFLWTSSRDVQLLEDLPGGEVCSNAQRISADGSVIVGRSHSDRGIEPVRWVNGKIESLLPRDGPHVGAHYKADAEAVSADGSTIAGKLAKYNDSTIELFVWNTQDGMRHIRLPSECTYIAVRAISRDGRVVTGHGKFPQDRAWIWTEEQGFDVFTANRSGSPFLQDVGCMAGDASFVVGSHQTGDQRDFYLSTLQASSYWGGEASLRTLQDACADLGIESVIPEGWKIVWISGISADGRRMVGYGSSPAGQQESFVIDLPADEDLGPVVGQRVMTEFVDKYQTSTFNCYASAFTPDLRTIVVSDERGTVELADRSGDRGYYAVLRGHTQRIWDLAVSPIEAQLASASADGTVKLWNLDRSQIQEVITETDSVPYDIGWSPDGRRLAIAFKNGSVRICDPSFRHLSTTVVYGDEHSCDYLAFSADSRRLYVGNRRNETVCLDANTGERIRSLGPESVGIDYIAFSNDGNWLIGRKEGKVCLLNLTGQQHVDPITRPVGEVNVFTSCPKEPLLAIGFDKWIELWDLNSHKKVRELKGHFRGIHALAFSLDGKRLASGGDDQEIRIWDVSTGKCLATIVGLQASVHTLSWCVNGGTLASSDANGMVNLWDVRTKQLLLSRNLHRRAVIQFSPDGQQLLTFRVARTPHFHIYRAPRTTQTEEARMLGSN